MRKLYLATFYAFKLIIIKSKKGRHHNHEVIIMDFECPLCNALINVDENCPRCGSKMNDYGRVEDYFAPYNPYLDRDLVSMGEPEHQCIHLFACPDCGYDSRMVINQIPV